MKSWLKIIFKAIIGGLVMVLLYLSWGLLRDVVNYWLQGTPCEDLIMIPVKLVVWLFLVTSWDDWAFLFFLFGSLLVLINQFRPMLNKSVQRHSRQVFITFQVVLLVLFGIGVIFEIQNDLAVQKAYAEVCHAVKDQNYRLAYSYFSPEYHSHTKLKGFVNDVKELVNAGYFDGCEGKFVGTIYHRWNGTRLYPYEYTESACYFFMGGPELTLVRINQRWYFTGENHWFLD
jgi:hypothetical protein